MPRQLLTRNVVKAADIHLVRKLTISNVMCGGREVQSLRHSADAIPEGFSNAVPGMKERVEER